MPIIGPGVTSPYTEIAEALAALLDAEFDDMGIVTQHDHLHDSLGYMGAVVGVSPGAERPTTGQMVQSEIYAEVRYFDQWSKEVNNEQQVDPRIITEKAERFKRAVQQVQASTPGDKHVWFFDVLEITYPTDPTGNKSRFIAVVRAFGQNSGMIETTG